MANIDDELLLTAGDDDLNVNEELDFDEDYLLGTVSRKNTQDSDQLENGGEQANEDDNFDKVEVDYGEDEHASGDEKKEEKVEEKKEGSRGRTDTHRNGNYKSRGNSSRYPNDGRSGPVPLMALNARPIIPPGLPLPPTSSGVRLRLDGQTFVSQPMQPMYPMMGMPQYMPPVGQVPFGMPSNHGMAGFGPGHRDRAPPRDIVHRALGAGQWTQAVDLFLNEGGRKPSRRRKHSYSSRSSSSRSRSRSPRRHHRRHEKNDRHRDERRRDRGGREGERRKRSTEKTTIESAKALGLDENYLRQVEEQKKKREEILRRKRDGRDPEKKPEPKASTSEREKKMKAYLAVNVTNVKSLLPSGVKRVEKMATDIGQIRKCWQSTDDIISVIFHEHEKAKEFVMKFNNKVIMGVRVTLDLEKKYLNLSEM